MTANQNPILVVDDEKDMCDLMARLLEKEGLKPITVNDGASALKMVRMAHPDVVLLDVRMPGMDGMEVMRRVKELDPDLPVVIITAYAGYMMTRNLSVELQLSQAFGDFSDALIASINLLAQPFPEWRASPFFLLGTGVIHTDPNVTLVSEEDRTDQITNVGVGLRVYLTRRFIFRAEYQNHVILQTTDDNQEIDEWKAGFAFFF